MLSFFRPEPKFRTGLLVRRLSPEYPNMRYMLIHSRRFIRSNQGGRKCWVYDGIILNTKDGEISYSTSITAASENSLDFILGIE